MNSKFFRKKIPAMLVKILFYIGTFFICMQSLVSAPYAQAKKTYIYKNFYYGETKHQIKRLENVQELPNESNSTLYDLSATTFAGYPVVQMYCFFNDKLDAVGVTTSDLNFPAYALKALTSNNFIPIDFRSSDTVKEMLSGYSTVRIDLIEDANKIQDAFKSIGGKQAVEIRFIKKSDLPKGAEDYDEAYKQAASSARFVLLRYDPDDGITALRFSLEKQCVLEREGAASTEKF